MYCCLGTLTNNDEFVIISLQLISRNRHLPSLSDITADIRHLSAAFYTYRTFYDEYAPRHYFGLHYVGVADKRSLFKCSEQLSMNIAWLSLVKTESTKFLLHSTALYIDWERGKSS